MSEKYNIPEPNSLHSMEGVENDFENLPESKKGAMDKVFDLFQPDKVIGMTTVFEEPEKNIDLEDTLEIFENILKDGLLGLWPRKDQNIESSRKDIWIQSMNKREGKFVFGNILNRDSGKYIDDELSSAWLSGINILYDLSGKEESTPTYEIVDEEIDKPHSFLKRSQYRAVGSTSFGTSFQKNKLDLLNYRIYPGLIRDLGFLSSQYGVNLSELKEQILARKDFIIEWMKKIVMTIRKSDQRIL